MPHVFGEQQTTNPRIPQVSVVSGTPVDVVQQSSRVADNSGKVEQVGVRWLTKFPLEELGVMLQAHNTRTLGG